MQARGGRKLIDRIEALPQAVRDIAWKGRGVDRGVDRGQCLCRGADLVGQGRKADIDALLGKSLGLPVQGQMLPELLKEDRGQEVGASPSPSCRVERRRRLADLLAIPTGELLTANLRSRGAGSPSTAGG